MEGLLQVGFLESRCSDGIAVQDVYKETPWGPTPMEGRGGDRHGQESRAP